MTARGRRPANDVERLLGFLRDLLPAFCERYANTSPDRFVTVSKTTRPDGRPSPDEARAFFRGIEGGVISVDKHGYVSFLESGAPPRWGPLWLLRRNSASAPETTVHVWWELLTQIMAFVELVLDHGWQPRRVGVDIDADTFDVGMFAEGGEDVLIAGEVKPTSAGLAKLLAEMRSCAEMGCSAGTRHATDGHKKYLGLRRVQPEFFWAVAPGVRSLFRVRVSGDRAALEPVEGLPTPATVTRRSKTRGPAAPRRQGAGSTRPNHAPGDPVAKGRFPIGSYVRGRAMQHGTETSRRYRLVAIDDEGPLLHEIWQETDPDGIKRFKHGRDDHIRGVVTDLLAPEAPQTVSTGTPGGETEEEFWARMSSL
jgi:hypothetical protein